MKQVYFWYDSDNGNFHIPRTTYNLPMNHIMKTTVKKPPLWERLREIRSKIVASGKPLLNADEIEKELADRRGGM
ncbi:MAG: hypothetical protein ACKOPK_00980 [Dolichospermum sp.]